MASIRSMYNNWCLEELRSSNQVNEDVWMAWFKKGLLTFNKMVLEYVSGMQNTAHIFRGIQKDKDEYQLPLNWTGVPDFYSIIQLRVAYHADKKWNPIYRICKPMNFSDYNIRPMKNQYNTDTGKLEQQWWHQVWWPMIRDRVSEISPRYVFVDKDTIKIFPTPTEDIDRWLTLAYNYMEDIESIDIDSTNIEDLNLPRYFMDAIDDYITFRLYQAENPEMAQWYYQQFENTLHDNIYWLNKDKRPVDEDFANTSYFSHY